MRSSNDQATPSTQGIPATSPAANGGTVYSVQHNSLWGHEFYTGKIDATGSVDVGSAPKQSIAELLNALTFPPTLSKSLVIANVDPTVIKTGDQLEIPWAVGSSARLDLQPKVGTYQNVHGGAVIALNNRSGFDKAVLTHELGHLIGAQLTDAEWQQYYKLRNIPSATPRRGSDWATSPFEDFAEVFKATYKSAVAGANASDAWNITTRYGFFVPANEAAEIFGSCYSIQQDVFRALQDSWMSTPEAKNAYTVPSEVRNTLGEQADADPKVQDCRRNSAEQSPFGGPAYMSQAGPATQQFIKGIVARLNKPVATPGNVSVSSATPLTCDDFEKQAKDQAKIFGFAGIYPPGVTNWTGSSATVIYRVFYSEKDRACLAGRYTTWVQSTGEVYIYEIDIVASPTEVVGLNSGVWARFLQPPKSKDAVIAELQSALEYYSQNGRGPQ